MKFCHKLDMKYKSFNFPKEGWKEGRIEFCLKLGLKIFLGRRKERRGRRRKNNSNSYNRGRRRAWESIDAGNVHKQ